MTNSQIFKLQKDSIIRNMRKDERLLFRCHLACVLNAWPFSAMFTSPSWSPVSWQSWNIMENSAMWTGTGRWGWLAEWTAPYSENEIKLIFISIAFCRKKMADTKLLLQRGLRKPAIRSLGLLNAHGRSNPSMQFEHVGHEDRNNVSHAPFLFVLPLRVTQWKWELWHISRPAHTLTGDVQIHRWTLCGYLGAPLPSTRPNLPRLWPLARWQGWKHRGNKRELYARPQCWIREVAKVVSDLSTIYFNGFDPETTKK